MVYRRGTRKPARRGIKKRWYVDASLPKSVPIIGGASFRAGSGLIKRMVKREVQNQEESKYLIFSGSSQTLTHDNVTTVAPWQTAPLQGVAVNQRVGTDIYVKNILLSMNILNIAGVFAKIRVLGVWLDKQIPLTPAVGLLHGPAVGVNDLFFTTTLGYTHGLINNKLDHTIICDKTYTIKPDYTGEVKNQLIRVNCPINKKVVYTGVAAPQFFKDKQLYFVFIPYTPNGTVGTTQVLQVSTDVMMTYKDS